MQFPARFADLPEYAFPRLRRLLDGVTPGGPELAMTIGEPKHPLPEMVGRIVAEHAAEFALYPPNEGTPELRVAIAGWLERRYGLDIDPATSLTDAHRIAHEAEHTLTHAVPKLSSALVHAYPAATPTQR